VITYVWLHSHPNHQNSPRLFRDGGTIVSATSWVVCAISDAIPPISKPGSIHLTPPVPLLGNIGLLVSCNAQ
jgi:hypothetical protein